MDKDELTVHLMDISDRNRWQSYKYEELPNGKIYFRVKHLSKKDSEIYFDDYESFSDFVALLSVS